MNADKSGKIAYGAMTAALYVVLTWVCNALGLTRLQIRLSEALCILPAFFPAAVPGLFVGCIISNLITGCVFIDIVFGSLATLGGALLTRHFRKNRYLAAASPVIVNTAVIPLVLYIGYNQPYILSLVSVFLGELISAGICGLVLFNYISKSDPPVA